MSYLWPVWFASLVGSLHCVGMCGGLVGFYAGSSVSSGGAKISGARRGLSHMAYHLCRLSGYLVLGAVAGQLGATLDWAGRLGGLQQVAALLAGATMIVWGAVALWRPRPSKGLVQLGKRALPGVWGRGLARVRQLLVSLTRRAREQPPVGRAALLGVSTALLPCGWLYAFVLAAAGSGSGWRGALLMGAFWAGTVPALLGLGVGVQWLSARLRPLLPRLSAGVLVCLGLANVLGRWPSLDVDTASAASCHVVD